MKYAALALLIVVASSLSIALAQELSNRDQTHIAVQDICPVTGQKLGEHGAPIKVKIGAEAVFLCCLQGKVNP